MNGVMAEQVGLHVYVIPKTDLYALYHYSNISTGRYTHTYEISTLILGPLVQQNTDIQYWYISNVLHACFITCNAGDKAILL